MISRRRMRLTLAAMTLASSMIVRRTDRVKVGVFSRGSRWVFATSGRSSAVTRRPAPGPGDSAAG